MIVVSSEQNQIAKNVSMVVQVVLGNVRNVMEEVSRSHDWMIYFFRDLQSETRDKRSTLILYHVPPLKLLHCKRTAQTNEVPNYSSVELCILFCRIIA